MNPGLSQIAEKILQGGNNIIFTGAGISTESGIPDYRSQGGIWDRFKPVYFDEFMSSENARVEYWQRWQELYQGLRQAT
ncbi:MAG: sigma factor regulator FecR, partial [Deltaproteobacteria bacterium]|nr:sigma factor regulator FecR [Deltaproteobacteria bacterium]